MHHVSSTPQTNSALSYQRRFLRLPEVMLRTGLKRTQIYTLMEKGDFPCKIKLGLRAIAWDSIEIDAWISERLEARTLERKPAAIH